MKALVIAFLSAFFILLLFYGLGAFIAWDIDPISWGMGLRLSISAVGIFFAVLVWLGVMEQISGPF